MHIYACIYIYNYTNVHVYIYIHVMRKAQSTPLPSPVFVYVRVVPFCTCGEAKCLLITSHLHARISLTRRKEMLNLSKSSGTTNECPWSIG